MYQVKRYDVLASAGQCVCGDRDKNYGSPEDSFTTIARMWNAYLDAKPVKVIDGKDVAAMMALLKVARIAAGVYKADNWIDLAGYAACGGEIEEIADRNSPVERPDEVSGGKKEGCLQYGGQKEAQESNNQAADKKPFRLKSKRVWTKDGEYEVPYVEQNKGV